MPDFVPETISILGTRVGVFESMNATVQLIHQRIVSRQRTFCVAINPEKVYRAEHDQNLRDVLSAADVPICDGVGVLLAAKFLYRKRMTRCTGIDLFMRLADQAAQEGWKIFLLGASPESNQGAQRELRKKFPGLQIAGSQSGFFEDSDAVVEQINRSGADMLFVAMGSPRQEYWIRDNMPKLNTSLCMGIGGSLDVLSGTVKRAPSFFQKTGTEWLFRVLSQPSRARRQVALPLFAMQVVKLAFARR